MNKLYYKLPIVLQHLLTSLYGYKLKKDRYNKIYYKYFEIYSESKVNSRKELEKLLIHLKNNIFKYKDININHAEVICSLKSLAMVSKDTLRA